MAIIVKLNNGSSVIGKLANGKVFVSAKHIKPELNGAYGAPMVEIGSDFYITYVKI